MTILAKGIPARVTSGGTLRMAFALALSMWEALWWNSPLMIQPPSLSIPPVSAWIMACTRRNIMTLP